MRIQQSMPRCSLHSMLLLNLILPIDVTFSTPTPHYTHLALGGELECNRLWLLKNSISGKWSEKSCARMLYKRRPLFW